MLAGAAGTHRCLLQLTDYSTRKHDVESASFVSQLVQAIVSDAFISSTVKIWVAKNTNVRQIKSALVD